MSEFLHKQGEVEQQRDAIHPILNGWQTELQKSLNDRWSGEKENGWWHRYSCFSDHEPSEETLGAIQVELRLSDAEGDWDEIRKGWVLVQQTSAGTFVAEYKLEDLPQEAAEEIQRKINVRINTLNEHRNLYFTESTLSHNEISKDQRESTHRMLDGLFGAPSALMRAIAIRLGKDPEFKDEKGFPADDFLRTLPLERLQAMSLYFSSIQNDFLFQQELQEFENGMDKNSSEYKNLQQMKKNGFSVILKYITNILLEKKDAAQQ